MKAFLRFSVALAIVAALAAAFVFASIAAFAFFAAVAAVAGIARLLGRGKRPPGPLTIEGESRRVE